LECTYDGAVVACRADESQDVRAGCENVDVKYSRSQSQTISAFLIIIINIINIIIIKRFFRLMTAADTRQNTKTTSQDLTMDRADHGQCGARTYNGGLGWSPQRGLGAKAP